MGNATTLIKLLAIITTTTILLLTHNLWLILLVFCSSIFATFILPNHKLLLRRLLPLLGIAAFTIILQIIFNSDKNYTHRLLYGFLVGLKLISISLLIFIFASITSISRLISLFNFLPGNFKITLTITFGILPIMLKEAENIRKIQISRGLKVRFWNIHKNIFPLIIPLLHRSFQRAERIAIRYYL